MSRLKRTPRDCRLASKFIIVFLFVWTSAACQGLTAANAANPEMSTKTATIVSSLPLTITPSTMPLHPTLTVEPTVETLTLGPTLPTISSSTPRPTFAVTPTPIFQGRIAVLTSPWPDPQSGLVNLHEGPRTLSIIDLTTKEVFPIHEDVRNFEWSPDGQELVFEAFDSDTWTYGIYVTAINNFKLMKLELSVVGSAHRGDPTWSPDGKQIAFSQPDAGEYLLHIANADGSDVRFLTKGVKPAWSPTGNHIAFLRLHSSGRAGYIFVIDIDGQNLHQLTEDVLADRPVWSPDGQYLAFYGEGLNGENNGIYMMDTTRDDLTFLVPSDGSPPSWSLDGSQIIFVPLRADGGAGSQLYAIPVDDPEGLTPLSLPPTKIYFSGALQPDPNQH